MLRTIDRFVGKHLYVPAIIFVCQRTGLTQFALHSYLWMLVFWWIVTKVVDRHIALAAVVIILTAVWTAMTAWNPDRERPIGPLWMRILALGILALEAVYSVATGTGWEEMIDTNAILFAEYALTIRTIPPREAKKLTAVKPTRAEA